MTRETAEERVPVFVRGTRLQRDRVRDQWVIQAPERVFLADPVAAAILQRVDGAASIAHIIEALAATFEAPRDVIARDVLAMIDDLMSRQVLECRS